MEIREFAERIFFADTLEGKLTNPAAHLLHPVTGMVELTDYDPGQAITWQTPCRPDSLQIAPKTRRKRLPKAHALHDPEMRIRCLHAFANHELMALEMMAWALLAYPNAPAHFRRGLVKIVLDEQEHCRLYIERIQKLGMSFGDLPLNDHFWRVGAGLTDPLKWVCCMHLTFEQANLDHAPYFEQAFRSVGDEDSGNLMRRIFEDEIMHVRFGARWLKHYKDKDVSLFDTYVNNLADNNPPGRARGIHFNVEARRRAGLDEDFITSVEACRLGEFRKLQNALRPQDEQPSSSSLKRSKNTRNSH